MKAVKEGIVSRVEITTDKGVLSVMGYVDETGLLAINRGRERWNLTHIATGMALLSEEHLRMVTECADVLARDHLDAVKMLRLEDGPNGPAVKTVRNALAALLLSRGRVWHLLAEDRQATKPRRRCAQPSAKAAR